MVKIILPAGWTMGRTEFEGSEGLLPDVIRRFAADNPSYGPRLLGPDDQLLTYINLSIDDDLILRAERAGTEVPAGSTVVVTAPMAGG
ncbi:MoaD/ThiS family protein [Amycolatopsis sp. H20-H5]|uniref:MoaD/ThiS family protein n=1 Tax=Amycolatopsis sp. H20-H5 TaxID=3046309 RepID=UPI002DB5E851|nr:MoaD/ThiS family protein [Amycolatopsis sp. H20-H5]MEC3976905.1 MoaD/ThiS family protein [Amycolatopsis sp. H20-H5]